MAKYGDGNGCDSKSEEKFVRAGKWIIRNDKARQKLTGCHKFENNENRMGI